MHKSKSVALLSSFSRDELKSFGDFLRSPFFNNNSRVVKLFEELKKAHPEYESRSISKENLYKKLFPGKAYNDQVIKNLNTELFKLEKDFLAHDMLGREPFEKSVMLLMNLTSRDAVQLFEKEAESIETSARENRSKIKDIHLLLNRIEEEKFTNDLINNRQSEATVHILKAGEYLILYFLKNILRININQRINEFSFNAVPEVNLPGEFLKKLDLEALLEFMDKNKTEHTIHIRLLYYSLLCNLNVKDSVIYLKFKKLLFESIDSFTKSEFHHLLHMLESIIAQKINSGMLEYYKDLFETYEYELKNDVYKPHKESPLTVMKYRNIYLSAMKAGKYEWAENFIHKYRDELQKKDRQSIVELSLAQLNFEKGNFEETLKHLQKVRTSQIFYKIDVKILSLMALYEIGHYETALASAESFKKMLAANKTLTEQYREKNKNFAAVFMSLVKAKADNSTGAKDEIMKKIEGITALANKNWLIRKTGGLNQK